MEPEYEPTAGEESASSGRNPYTLVLMSGAATTALTLAGVYWLSKNATDFHIMGWYANFVIPVGAILVGAAAGSGYAIASWLSGVRISGPLLLTVLLLQLGAYVAAEYIEYRDVTQDLARQGMVPEAMPGFLEYYDFKARSFAWKPKHGNQPGDPLGLWGYVFVLLGAAGFVLSGMIAPALLALVPYCERCQRYMKTKQLGVLPASVPAKKIGKKDLAAQEAHAKEQAEAAAKAEETLARFHQAVADGSADAVKQELKSAGPPKANEALPRRVRVSLSWCKGCSQGRIVTTLMEGTADQVQQTRLAETAVPPDFVRRILEA